MDRKTIRINEIIKEKEDNAQGQIIRIQPTEFMQEVTGMRENKSFLTFAGKVFRKRGWQLRRYSHGSRAWYWQYLPNNAKNEDFWK